MNFSAYRELKFQITKNDKINKKNDKKCQKMTKKFANKKKNNNNLATSKIAERRARGKKIREIDFFRLFVKIDQIEKDKSRRTRKKLIYRIAMLNAARVQKTPSKSLAWMLVFFFQCERKA